MDNNIKSFKDVRLELKEYNSLQVDIVKTCFGENKKNNKIRKEFVDYFTQGIETYDFNTPPKVIDDRNVYTISENILIQKFSLLDKDDIDIIVKNIDFGDNLMGLTYILADSNSDLEEPIIINRNFLKAF